MTTPTPEGDGLRIARSFFPPPSATLNAYRLNTFMFVVQARSELHSPSLILPTAQPLALTSGKWFFRNAWLNSHRARMRAKSYLRALRWFRDNFVYAYTNLFNRYIFLALTKTPHAFDILISRNIGVHHVANRCLCFRNMGKILLLLLPLLLLNAKSSFD